MSYKACDIFERVVYFKEKIYDCEVGCYIAVDAQTDISAYYKVRHRENGPAIINHKGERRWFVDGNEITNKVEQFLAKNTDVFKLNDDEFSLNYKIYNKMKLLGVFNFD